MKTIIKQVWPLYFGLLLVGIATGLSPSLMSLRSIAEGFSGTVIAMLFTGYYLGYLGGSLRATQLIASIGHRRAFAVCIAVVAASNMVIPLFPLPWVWISLQLLIGFSFGALYVTTESWLNLIATSSNRGRLLALYMFSWMLGLSAGPFLLNVYDPASYELFAIVSVLCVMAAIPVLMNNHVIPGQSNHKRLPLTTLWRYAPHSIAAMFLISLQASCISSVAAVYSAGVGMDTEETSLFISLMFFGGFLLQWPLGYLSDRYNRFTIFSISAISCALVSLIATFSSDNWLIYPLAFIFGGLSFPLYSLCASTIYDRVKIDEIVPASSSVILLGCLGSIGGPSLATGVMEIFGSNAFFFLQGALCTMAGILMLLRRTQKRYNSTGLQS